MNEQDRLVMLEDLLKKHVRALRTAKEMILNPNLTHDTKAVILRAFDQLVRESEDEVGAV